MMQPTTRQLAFLFALLSCVACDFPNGTGGASAQQEAMPPSCRVVGSGDLPDVLFETSGIAAGVRDTTVVWTHNDGQEALLHQLDSAGVVRSQATVEGIALEDWEDLESSRCSGEPCLLLADIGDNDAKRDAVAIYEMTEPVPGGEATLLRTLRVRYPDAAQDAEALFALPDGRRFIVTKGRHGPIALYGVPVDSAATGVLRLERIGELAARPANELDRVTAASSSPSGAWIAVRSYRTLRVYRANDLLGGGQAAIEFDLRGIGETQGEGISIDDAGDVWLTSESETGRPPPTWTRLSCSLPASAGSD
jgi:hypothetical protein